MMQAHGELREVRVLTHFPDFNVELEFSDGTVIHSGARTGSLDIHMLRFGYFGTGPEMAWDFLDECGWKCLYEEIAEIRPVTRLTKENGAIHAQSIEDGEPVGEKRELRKVKAPRLTDVIDDLEALGQMIDDGADVADYSDDGSTVLTLAAGQARTKTVGFLLDKGLDINQPDRWDRTPLIMVIYNCRNESAYINTLRLLLERGADIEDMTFGATPLALAAQEKTPVFAKILLEAGANPNAIDSSGWAPLRHAARHGRHKIVRMLIDAGAHPSPKALEQCENERAARMLREHLGLPEPEAEPVPAPEPPPEAAAGIEQLTGHEEEPRRRSWWEFWK